MCKALTDSPRLIAISQVLWFSADCIGRVALNLEVTTLELNTLGFILVVLAISFCWRHKPSDVGHATLLRCDTTISEILTKVDIPSHRIRTV